MSSCKMPYWLKADENYVIFGCDMIEKETTKIHNPQCLLQLDTYLSKKIHLVQEWTLKELNIKMNVEKCSLNHLSIVLCITMEYIH